MVLLDKNCRKTTLRFLQTDHTLENFQEVQDVPLPNKLWKGFDSCLPVGVSKKERAATRLVSAVEMPLFWVLALVASMWPRTVVGKC